MIHRIPFATMFLCAVAASPYNDCEQISTLAAMEDFADQVHCCLGLIDDCSGWCNHEGVSPSCWDTTFVTNMDGAFARIVDFDEPIGHWNVSGVTSMDGMFVEAEKFNQPIGDWDVSRVSSMNWMFDNAKAFDRRIRDWDVSSVESMNGMFNGAISFNQNLRHWDVSSVTSMYSMFQGAQSFNGRLLKWDVSNVLSMSNMFSYATSFDQDIGKWDVSNVREMNFMFNQANSFNKNIDTWKVSSLTRAEHMFMNSFSQCLSTFGATIPEVAITTGIFAGTECPNPEDPSAGVGPWCEGPMEGCYFCANSPNSFSIEGVSMSCKDVAAFPKKARKRLCKINSELRHKCHGLCNPKICPCADSPKEFKVNKVKTTCEEIRQDYRGECYLHNKVYKNCPGICNYECPNNLMMP